MSNQIYIPPINFNEFDNSTSPITKINAVEPLEYNKSNSQLSIKAASENNYGVVTTGSQFFKGYKNFSDGITVQDADIISLSLTSETISTDPSNDIDITNKIT